MWQLKGIWKRVRLDLNSARAQINHVQILYEKRERLAAALHETGEADGKKTSRREVPADNRRRY